MWKFTFPVFVAVLTWGLAPATARGADGEPDGVVAVDLKDGSRLLGEIVSRDEETLTLQLSGGTALRVPRTSVASVEPCARPEPLERSDPNATRLLFTPTGRPLPRGGGYFSDHYVVFPGFAYGVSDHFSLGGGISTVPGLGLGEQLYYVAPRLAWQASPKLAISTGTLYAAGGGSDEALALVYGVVTLGAPARSFSAGLAVGGTREAEWEWTGDATTHRRRWHWRSAPILMLGGSLQLSPRVGLVSENWLFLGERFDLAQQPFALALRLGGNRLSADVGFVVVPAVLDEGVPLPWLSITYHFGPSRGRDAARLAARERHGASPPPLRGRR